MAELAAATGLPVRKLRYVVDHRVMPGQRHATAGQGVPRTFTDFEGFGIAVAARLLDAGLTRRVVAAGLAAAGTTPATSTAAADVPLLRAYALAAGTLEIGDARHLRIRAPGRPGVGDAVDTGWMPLTSSARAAPDYAPVVLVAMVLGGLARAVQNRRPVTRSVW